MSGSVRFGGEELLGKDDRALRKLRGADMAMVFQDPLSSLNPTVTIGTQVTEVLLEHRDMNKQAAAEAVVLLDKVGHPRPPQAAREYRTSSPAACASAR